MRKSESSQKKEKGKEAVSASTPVTTNTQTNKLQPLLTQALKIIKAGFDYKITDPAIQ